MLQKWRMSLAILETTLNIAEIMMRSSHTITATGKVTKTNRLSEIDQDIGLIIRVVRILLHLLPRLRMGAVFGRARESSKGVSMALQLMLCPE